MDDRWRQPPAFVIRDDQRDAGIHRCDELIRCTEIDADDFAHVQAENLTANPR